MMLRHTGTGPSRHLHLLTIGLSRWTDCPSWCVRMGRRLIPVATYNYPDGLQIDDEALLRNDECFFLLKKIWYALYMQWVDIWQCDLHIGGGEGFLSGWTSIDTRNDDDDDENNAMMYKFVSSTSSAAPSQQSTTLPTMMITITKSCWIPILH